MKIKTKACTQDQYDHIRSPEVREEDQTGKWYHGWLHLKPGQKAAPPKASKPPKVPKVPKLPTVPQVPVIDEPEEKKSGLQSFKNWKKEK